MNPTRYPRYSLLKIRTLPALTWGNFQHITKIGAVFICRYLQHTSELINP